MHPFSTPSHNVSLERAKPLLFSTVDERKVQERYKRRLSRAMGGSTGADDSTSEAGSRRGSVCNAWPVPTIPLQLLLGAWERVKV